MASILMSAMPFAGHVAPVAAVARELVRRGHDVRVHTGSAYATTFADAGATPVPWRHARDFDERDLAATFPRLRDRKGARQMIANVQALFLGTAAGQCADLHDEFRRRPWDLVAADSLALGARFAAELSRRPRVALSVVPLAIPDRDAPPPFLGLDPLPGPVGRLRDAALWGALEVATTPLRRAYGRARRDAGLGPTPERLDEVWLGGDDVVASGVPALDRRESWPGLARFVGDIAWEPGGAVSPRPARLPDWWHDVRTAEVPVVHVTQGTYNVDPHDLILPSVEALAGRDVLTVVGLAPRTPPLPGPLPANARVATMLPYDELLPRTAVVVTNGGWGGVLAALRHGVPLVVAGGDLDKPEIAARVQRAGAGVNLRTGTPTARQVRDGVGQVLTHGRYAAAAARIGADLRAAGGAPAAADAIERHLP
ncbi:glycosyltransferase [Isoptericola hypogeus]|uniref:Glycosyltransferase n=1 Tax=Isoptericola hypogeus TaxID=300179 RepID=A0ABP4VRC5_9MICO